MCMSVRYICGGHIDVYVLVCCTCIYVSSCAGGQGSALCVVPRKPSFCSFGGWPGTYQVG